MCALVGSKEREVAVSWCGVYGLLVVVVGTQNKVARIVAGIVFCVEVCMRSREPL